jgi:hypothetical protein
MIRERAVSAQTYRAYSIFQAIESSWPPNLTSHEASLQREHDRGVGGQVEDELSATVRQGAA